MGRTLTGEAEGCDIVQSIGENLWQQRHVVKRLAVGVSNDYIKYLDEYLVECNEDICKDVGELMCKSYEEASIACWEWHKKHSKWFTGNSLPTFMFNLDGGWKMGDNYYDVH